MSGAVTRRNTIAIGATLRLRYRSVEPVRKFAPIEQAERSAIIDALRERDGNKVKAAQTLGISRTTLYSKMRALRITVY